jgi:hypothetical protein
MLADKFKVNFASGKKNDVKLFAIAGVMLLVLLGLLFWLFSGSSGKVEVGGDIVPSNVVQAQVAQAQVSTTPPVPIIDESAAQNVIGSDSEEQLPPPTLQEFVNTQSSQEGIIDPQSGASLLPQADIRSDGGSFPAGAGDGVRTINRINTVTDMKKYLNDIKKDITIGRGTFSYLGNSYKAGDSFNSLSVVKVGSFYVRFASEDWEYSLRFLEGRK